MNDLVILQLLEELEMLLKKYKVRLWMSRISGLKNDYQTAIQENQQIRKDIVLDEIKELFGGMGSFNDYVITHLHGDDILSEHEKAANEQLNTIRHQLAEAIRNSTSL